MLCRGAFGKLSTKDLKEDDQELRPQTQFVKGQTHTMDNLLSAYV